MANVRKFTRAQSGAIINHDTRKQRLSNDVFVERSYGESKVDPSRTHLNYRLDGDEDAAVKLERRLSEVYCYGKKNLVTSCSWVVHVPSDGSVSEAEHRKFFETVYRFFNSNYGEKNVVIAQVHLDETSPHLHYVFCPVVKNNNKNAARQGAEKVCARQVLTPSHLKKLHKDLKREVERALGHPVSLLLDRGDPSRAQNELTQHELREAASRGKQQAQEFVESLPEPPKPILGLVSAGKQHSHDQQIKETLTKKIEEDQIVITGLSAKVGKQQGAIKFLADKVDEQKRRHATELQKRDSHIQALRQQVGSMALVKRYADRIGKALSALHSRLRRQAWDVCAKVRRFRSVQAVVRQNTAVVLEQERRASLTDWQRLAEDTPNRQDYIETVQDYLKDAVRTGQDFDIDAIRETLTADERRDMIAFIGRVRNESFKASNQDKRTTHRRFR